METPDRQPKKESFIFSKGTIVACVVLLVTGFLIMTGHSAHLFGFLPFLLILACPLMHIFMHGGHHHDDDQHEHEHEHEHHHDNDKKEDK